MNKEVEYLKEHLYEIYKYKKSMKDLTYDMDIEHLLRTCKALYYLQKEILKRDNILKEVREYIERETKELYSRNKSCKYLGEIMQLENVLEILDKVGETDAKD